MADPADSRRLVPMALTVVADGPVPFVEGPPGQPLVGSAHEFSLVIEACFSSGAGAALLHAENLPASFFDLSSREAGAVLQQLQNYRLRLAVVCAPGSVSLSSRFGDMLAEVRQGGRFNIFETRTAAVDWIAAAR